MKRYIEELTPVPQALSLLKKKVKPISEWTQVPLWEGQGLVLAKDIIMPHDYPPRPKSAYDGYAVRSSDTPGKLKLLGEAPIGVTDVGFRVGEGEAVYVTTGAYLPEGADAVVPEEYVERGEDYIIVKEKYEKWANVDPPGVYVKKGDVVLREGSILTAPDIVGLLDVGVTKATVYRPVRVAVIETGNELFKPHDPEETRRKILEGLVVATTGDFIVWFINEYLSWVEVIDLVTLPDNLETLVWYIDRLLYRADMVLISGGTGPSEIDLFYRLPEALGGELVFRGLFVKGGRPTSAVVVNGKPIIGLSGYPLSALHGFLRLVYPLLAYMGNAKTPPPVPFYWATLTKPLSIKRPRPIKVRLERGDDGVLYATPLEKKMQNSSAIIALALADGVAFTDNKEYRPGDRVLVLAYRLPKGYHLPSINL